MKYDTKLKINLIKVLQMKKMAIAGVMIATFSASYAENSKTNGFSYDYVQGTYALSPIEQNIEESIVSADFEGYNLSVSKALTDNIFVTAAYGSLSTNSIKVDGTTLPIKGTGTSTSFGIGYRMPINDKTDFSIEIQSLEVATKGSLAGVELISETDTTTPVTATLRFMVTPEFELQTSYGYDDGDSVYTIGGGFSVNKQIAVVGGYSKVEGGSSTSIGLRYNF
jgi:hypothetical protein